MPKILFSLDSNHYSENLIHVADSLLKHSEKIKDVYTGIVVKEESEKKKNDPISHNRLKIKKLFSSQVEIGDLMEDEDVEKAGIIRHFQKEVRDSGVNYELHLDEGQIIDELIKETAFADILISGFSNNFISHSCTNEHLNLIISCCQCSLLLIPGKVNEVENIVMVYDGSIESVKAIKNFSRLCKKASEKKRITLLSVVPKTTSENRKEKMMVELVKANFANTGIIPLEKEDIIQTTKNICSSITSPLLVIKDIFIPTAGSSDIASELVSWNVPLYISRT